MWPVCKSSFACPLMGVLLDVVIKQINCFFLVNNWNVVTSELFHKEDRIFRSFFSSKFRKYRSEDDLLSEHSCGHNN